MDKSNFNQTLGYPLTTERLQELQTAYSIFNAFGGIVGNKTIITGCELLGSTIQNGAIFLDGEILEFRKATLTANSTVIIIEEPVSKSFKNGTIKQVHTTRFATFGTNPISWPWSDFVRPIQTKELQGLLNLKADQSLVLLLAQYKADKINLDILANRVLELENKANNPIAVPQIRAVSGSVLVQNRQNGDNSDVWDKNYHYVYPPAGFTISHLQGFIASIGSIKFDGEVDRTDGIWCRHKVETALNRITIICGAAEQRAVPIVNYIGVWQK